MTIIEKITKSNPSSENAKKAKAHIMKATLNEAMMLIDMGCISEDELDDVLGGSGSMLEILGDFVQCCKPSIAEFFEKVPTFFDEDESKREEENEEEEKQSQETGDFEPTEEDRKIQKQIAKTQKALDKAIKATLKTIKLISAASEEGKEDEDADSSHND